MMQREFFAWCLVVALCIATVILFLDLADARRAHQRDLEAAAALAAKQLASVRTMSEMVQGARLEEQTWRARVKEIERAWNAERAEKLDERPVPVSRSRWSGLPSGRMFDR